MPTIDFILGEVKDVKVKITSRVNDVFTIQSAIYELSIGSVVEDSGSCVIDSDNHILIIQQLEPKSTGNYDLMITYGIADQKFKKRLEVNVS